MMQKISYDENSEAWSMKRTLSHGLLTPCCLKVMLSRWFLKNFGYASKTSGHVKKRAASSRIASWYRHNYCLGSSFATKPPDEICILCVFIYWGVKAFLLYHLSYEDRCWVASEVGCAFVSYKVDQPSIFSASYTSRAQVSCEWLTWALGLINQIRQWRGSLVVVLRTHNEHTLHAQGRFEQHFSGK